MEKPTAFHMETLVLLGKYEDLIKYLNECKIFPDKIIMVIDKPTARKIVIETLSQ